MTTSTYHKNSSMCEPAGIFAVGRLRIIDSTTNECILDAQNHINPQNLARVIARGLAAQLNSSIFRMAFGNGGTITDITGNVTSRAPNTSAWDGRLYHETFSKVVDDTSALVGTDTGSADVSTLVRSGGGAIPVGTNTCESFDGGFTSTVVVTATLGGAEPITQLLDTSPDTNAAELFRFDEICLYTTGAQAISTPATHRVSVGNKTAQDDTALQPGRIYTLGVVVDGAETTLRFEVPGLFPPTFQEFIVALDQGAWGMSRSLASLGVAVAITGDGTEVPTYGQLEFRRTATGSVHSLLIAPDSSVIPALSTTVGRLTSPIPGTDSGARNNAASPTSERERMLTHLIFAPITKRADRTYVFEYTITVSVQ